MRNYNCYTHDTQNIIDEDDIRFYNSRAERESKRVQREHKTSIVIQKLIGLLSIILATITMFVLHELFVTICFVIMGIGLFLTKKVYIDL